MELFVVHAKKKGTPHNVILHMEGFCMLRKKKFEPVIGNMYKWCGRRNELDESQYLISVDRGERVFYGPFWVYLKLEYE